MLPVLNRFHFLSTLEEGSSFLFARLLHDELQLIQDDKAYKAFLRDCTVIGATIPVTSSLLSLLLCNPSTKACVERASYDNNASHENIMLHLSLVDKNCVELHLMVQLVNTMASSLLHALFTSLLAGLAGYEGLLLSVANEAASSQDLVKSDVSLSKLNELNAPSLHLGNPITEVAAFRRAVANDMSVVATRALVIAAGAARVRDEVVERQRERNAEEVKRRKRMKRMVQEAKQIATQRPQKQLSVNLFDDDSSTASNEGRAAASNEPGGLEDNMNDPPLREGKNESSKANDGGGGICQQQSSKNLAANEEVNDERGKNESPKLSPKKPGLNSHTGHTSSQTSAISQPKRKKRKITKIV